ncbi:MAG: hypothetical protein H5T86_07820 [Armatimonadetes bacterium]|nr:hypothetical protein [Armatimonadota bacterium]
MSWEYEEDDLLDLIGELELADADGWLVSCLFELAVTLLADADELHSEVGVAIASAIRVLWQSTGDLNEALDNAVTQLSDLARVAAWLRTAAEFAMDGITRAWPSSPAQRSARELALAACHVRLDNIVRAEAHVEAAVDAGATDAVAYLALGCLRYRRAVTEFGPAEMLDNRSLLRFQLACLRAVSALEQGLGGDLDAHLYWWIATALEPAGFDEAAAEAWRRYEAAEEEDYGDGEEAEEETAEQSLPQISPDEERRVAEALKDPRTLQWLLGGADESPE